MFPRTLYFNAAVRQGLPPSCSHSVIFSIFKNGDRGNPSCYRPISLVGMEVKILGRIVLNKLQLWAKEQDILCDTQYGFRAGLGTMEQCLNLYMAAAKYMVAKNSSIQILWTSVQPSTV